MTADITIVGLGPGPAALRTVAAQHALDSAQHIFVRSHEGVQLDDLVHMPNVTDLTPFHDRGASVRWHRAIDAVIASAHLAPVVLAIPGHPRFGEGLVRGVLAKAESIGLTTDVIEGLSATDMLASALDVDPINQRVQLVSGWALAAADREKPFDGGLIDLSPARPVLVTHLYSEEFCAAAARQLMRVFPAHHGIELITSAGLPEENRAWSTIADLATHPGNSMLAVFVPSLGQLEASRSAATLQHIVARLRRPDGCPWDRDLTLAKLVPDLVEEVYEVVDAVAANDLVNLAEELGDVTLLVMMLAQIAEEHGDFALEDVYEGIATKIVRRHPHVFGDVDVTSPNDVLGVWAEVKAQENAERPKPVKADDGLPWSMPRLAHAAETLQDAPLPTVSLTAEDRASALLQAISDIVAAGDDPNDILMNAIINHTTVSAAGAKE